MHPSLDMDRYAGAADRVAGPDSGFISRAVFDGVIACADAPRGALMSILPESLVLASAAEEATHPLLFIFGAQTRGASHYGGAEIEWGVRYDELIVVVPFVCVRRTRRLCNYSPAMISSYEVPNQVGRVSYGFPKQIGLRQRFGAIETFSTRGHGLAFQAHVTERETWRDFADMPAEARAPITRLARVTALPWVGCKPNGRFVHSYSKWSFDAACIRPADVTATLQPSLAPGLPTTPLTTSPDATYLVRGMDWALSWPRSIVV